MSAISEPLLRTLPLAALIPSKTHVQELRRLRFASPKGKQALDELTASIKEKGLLQNLVARPIGQDGKLEIVAGERRWIAAKRAGVAAVLVNVLSLSDEQVLEVQLIENLQREDLHELEEAEGYEELMKLKKITADQVADMVGKSRSYVYARLKLTALCPEARKAFYAGDLDASKALLIARIGHHDTQRAALKDITLGEERQRGRREGEPMSYREAHQHILKNYMLALVKAPFDIKDATLLPKAGDCIGCHKRTGNQADLFGDVKSADVCTDPKCFDEKRQAQFAKVAKELAAKGKTVIAGDDAKKIFPEWDANFEHSRDRMSERYVPMNGETYIQGRGYVSPQEVLGDDFEPTLIQHPGSGRIFAVASQQALAAAANKGQQRRAAKASSAKKKPQGPDVDEVLTERLAKLMVEKAPKEFGRSWYVSLAKEVRQHLSTRDLDAVALAWKWKSNSFNAGYSRRLPAEAAKLGERDLVLLMFHMIFAIGAYSRKPVLQLFGIDEPKVREQILEERKAAQKKAREEAKAPKEKKSPAAAAIDAGALRLGSVPTWSGAVLKQKALGNRFSFMAPMLPSDQLALITGPKALVRTEVTKKIWGYIKRNGLQDKKNRRFINADDRLKLLFKGKKRVSMFEMTKFVSVHLRQVKAAKKAKAKPKGKKK